MLDIIANYHYMQFQGKLMNQTWENSKKIALGPILAQIWTARIFFQKSGFVSRWYHGQLSSCTISEKKLIQSWENVVTDESDFIGHCPTNIERPI